MKKLVFTLCFISTTLFAQDSKQLTSAFTVFQPETPLSSRGGPAQYCSNNMLLDQLPNQSTSYYSDVDCDVCSNGLVQVLAENFVLVSDNSLSELVIYGSYYSNDIPLVTDIFTVNILDDNAGVPGTILYTEDDVASTRALTGLTVGSSDEYRFNLTLGSLVDLEAGTYWVEIHNDSTVTTEDFAWGTGIAGTNSITDVAGAFEYPVVTWIDAPIGELAMQVCGEYYAVDINVSGLAPTNSVSFSNGTDTLTMTDNITDTISTLDDLTSYNLNITSQPDTPNQVCSITSGNGSGNMAGSTVTIDVVCTTQYSVEVNVSGLAATNSVSFSNGGDTLSIAANGTQTITTADDGTAFDVDITAQPDTPNQVCSFDNADSGNLAGGNATVNVSCVTTQYAVDVSVTGLAATNSVSFSNGGDTLSFNADGTQTISTLNDESAFDVDITAQPDSPNQVCSFDNADSGNLAGGNATVNVSCVTTQYNVDVNVSGLAATNSVSFSNGVDTLSIAANGTQTITTADDGSAFDVDIMAQPDTPNQVCSFDNADSGNLAGGDATVNVSCVTTQYTVGVDVSGLAAGNSVIFQNNGGDDLNVGANGVSTFATALDDGSAYNVTVLTQPTSPNQTCVVSSPTGNLAGSNVGLTVNCTTTQYNVEVSVSGLAATNSVSFSNGGDTLSIAADGTETISTLDDGSAFDVDITAQPDTPNQVCSFDNADSGNLADGDATVNVSCVTTQYTVGVDVSGLAAGNSVTFQNNAGDDLTASTNGISTFATALDDGSVYNVSVLSQPSMTNQTCVVSNPVGNLAGSNIDLSVTCTTTQYNVDVSVTGLTATNSVSFSNGGDSLTIGTDGTQTISTLDDGSAFDVDITAQPDTPNQVCSFDNADSGNLAGGDTTVNVSCVTTQYPIYVIVSGLAANNSVTFSNGTDTLTVSDSEFNILSTLDDGSAYDVSITTQPTTPNQVCTILSGNASGTLNGSHEELHVDCEISEYFIGGNVTGLLKNSMVILQNNGQETEIITCNGPFVFNTPQNDLTGYSITVHTNPQSPIQECTLSQDSGTVSGNDVITVELDCDYEISGDYLFSDGFNGSPFCSPVN